MSNRLKIALQKSGRLSELTFEIIEKCGLTFSRSKNNLICSAEELPIDLLLVRDDDIPGLVRSKICDLGFVGENVYLEETYKDAQPEAIEITYKLGFAKCRLCLAGPQEFQYTSPSQLQGKKIATSYPAILNAFLARNGITAEAVAMNGSVEVAPRLKIADLICDLVSTGATLEANGLKIIETILQSQAVIIRRAENLGAEKEAIIERLIKRIQGTLSARQNKYIVMHAPRHSLSDVVRLIPGCESPTIAQLEHTPDHVSVAAVCEENIFWETIEQLKAAGASSILVLPIEKMLR